MNRGSVRGAISSHMDFEASMRPRFMNRGSDAVGDPLRESLLRFNEAPIHESGKCCAGWRNTNKETGFNEAPIHESGK